jgi:osomolarity two-component system, sensor histidine kinase NIK1
VITLQKANQFMGSPSGSPLVVPPGPLAAAAFESGLSAVEELKLLKAQVQDVARVCKAGDLSQRITIPVQGVVMAQLKEAINAMVRNLRPGALGVVGLESGGGSTGQRGNGATGLDFAIAPFS